MWACVSQCSYDNCLIVHNPSLNAPLPRDTLCDISPSRGGRSGLSVLLWGLQVHGWNLFFTVSHGVLCYLTGDQFLAYIQSTFYFPRETTNMWCISGISVAGRPTLVLFQGSGSQSEDPVCNACDPSCLDCRGPGAWNCTMCPALQILSDDGRCLTCCGNETNHHDKPIPWECCDCTASRGNHSLVFERWLPAFVISSAFSRLLGRLSSVTAARCDSCNWADQRVIVLLPVRVFQNDHSVPSLWQPPTTLHLIVLERSHARRWLL